MSTQLSSSFISIGSLNKQMKYPLLMGCTHVFIKIASEIMRNNDLSKHSLIQSFVMFLGEFLIVFLFIIELKRSQSKVYKFKGFYLETLLKITGLIFLCTLIDFVGSFALTIIDSLSETAFFELVFKLFAMGLTAFLSQYLLHYKYYRHHILDYSILVFGLAAHLIIESFDKLKETQTNILSIILLLFFYSLSSFLEIIEKYLMEEEFVSPYLIISGEGAFGLIITSLCFTWMDEQCPKDFLRCKGENITKKSHYIEDFAKFFSNFDNCLSIILFFIGVFFVNTFRMLVNHSYSPTHRSIADTLSSFIFWILKLCYDIFISKNEDISVEHNILIGITYIVMYIGIFIFLELIIIHKCGMDKNTRDIINIRVNDEKKEIDNLPNLCVLLQTHEKENTLIEKEIY